MRRADARKLAAGLALSAAALISTARAETDEALLTGALAKAAKSGVVVIAARDDAPPFAFRDRSGRPVGYSIDLCAEIVEDIARAVGRDDLRVEFLPVTAQTRLPAIVEGRADLECGSTTETVERAKEVAFSPLIFVSGVRLLVPSAAPWRDIRDLAGKRVAVAAGTTNLEAVKGLNELLGLGLSLVESADQEDGFRKLELGEADAFAADEVLLAGLIARHRAADRFRIAGAYLSYEPYGIVYRRGDAAMGAAVEGGLRRLAASHDLEAIYARWFGRRSPAGDALGLPMSPQLEETFEALGRPVNADAR